MRITDDDNREHDSMCCLNEDHVGPCHSAEGYVLE